MKAIKDLTNEEKEFISLHYNKDMKGYWNSPNPANDFIKIKQNDIIKNEYCLKYNIPLVRIPY